ncbi:MAG: YraN family protein [Candidatus Thiodiazotropha sp. (ex Lucinoma aequizonata)]|nr:YraN family protein [Candidatus Thiodiazotropha sp. (ex Lucinoma aequizonata)]MCU7888732.1 YraN family protein [Candidatus Thiodiazotropha sp. (ex Lucinoma aequizonata)]MCU7896198.1 YraN family protein [Candidatus Thiodiazotropha sp. (ex Lucinoma aequizonata)]MCU7897462.1 YraN family protein [Candidatus Thiodiazotropha sp. (ex Lucinoma aequizonata)]MCU7902046.1 YraN family protein [Candidatus Thiodiazotropha sp. (ex Lucinoma aequizonata)]
MMAEHLVQGQQAEQQALDFLLGRGLKLLERNYRCKTAEINLIMREAGTLVFVEVRYRQSNDFGRAVEIVTASKQRKLLATANRYLQMLKKDATYRFDVIALNGSRATRIDKRVFDLVMCIGVVQ